VAEDESSRPRASANASPRGAATLILGHPRAVLNSKRSFRVFFKTPVDSERIERPEVTFGASASSISLKGEPNLLGVCPEPSRSQHLLSKALREEGCVGSGNLVA